MSSKRKKPTSSASRHKYTTREIMEITEHRRVKREVVEKDAVPEIKVPENKPDPVIIEDTKPFISEPAVSSIKEENTGAIKSKSVIPSIIVARSLAFVLWLIALLFIISSKFLASWTYIIANKLNALVVYGSFFVLSVIQGSNTVDGVVLNTHYYKISLQDDWVAFYSIELLIIFALLFAFFQKITRIKRGVVYVSLFPLAIVANIFRVVMSCGFALNYGPSYADQCFHGLLAGSVFIIIILGLIFLEYISSPE